MTPDPLDQLSARLFQAAREEPPPEGAQRRVLLAVRAAEPAPVARLRTAGIACGVIALAAAVVLWARREEPPSRISAEPIRPVLHAISPPAPASAPVVSSTQVPVKAAPSASTPHALTSAPVTLDDELTALKRASSSLESGDARGALAALDQYDHVLKGKKLRAEATVLRIEALSRAGEREKASALAQQFVDQNPESPLVDRARSFTQPK